MHKLGNFDEIDSNRYSTFLFEYRYKNSTWLIELKAQSLAEAEDRLLVVGGGKIMGKKIVGIPNSLGWIAKFTVFVRNILS